MNIDQVLKALTNPVRRQIVHWLEAPNKHFVPKCEGVDLEHDGVCVGQIQEKTGLSQSTVSHYLTLLEQAGLVIQQRQGQWTYYKRNQTAIDELTVWLGKNL